MSRGALPLVVGCIVLAGLLPVILSTRYVSGATTLPPRFEDTLLTPLEYPTALAFTPDERLLLTSQTGKLYVYQDGALVTEPALDLSSRVCFDAYLGLLGVAVDPAFTQNRQIYLFYTFRKRPGCPPGDTGRVNRVSRFVLSNSNVVDPASEVVLVDALTAGAHAGGDLQFGKDGYLYISTGDGGCDYAGDSGCGADNDAARDEHVLLGKILRITRDGAIPPDNPYQGSDSVRCHLAGRTTPGEKCRETFAGGLRNPFRMAFDPNAADTRFFINDVGHNTWEEINLGQARADYGWNVREGHCATDSLTNCGPPPAGMTNPIYDYSHTSGCASITGGAFVPNGVWPAEYDNAYLFGDYVCGKIFKLTSQGGSTSTVTEFATGLGSSSAIAMTFGPAGTTQALYYTTLVNGGEVRRISYIGAGNMAPIAAAAASPTFGAVPLEVSFDASGSSDPDGDLLTYEWDFGDGSAHSTSATPTHIYAEEGTYYATVTVRDPGGRAAHTSVRIDVGNTPPLPSIISPTESLRFRVGQVITLDARAVDAEDGLLPDTSLEWSAKLHHNNTHTHPFLEPTTGNNIMITAPEPEDLAAAETGFLELILTATDSRGLTSVVTQALRPNLVDMTFATEPPGIELELNGSPTSTPQTVISWENYELEVDAPAQVVNNGQLLAFDRWSDGSTERVRVITTPTSAASYTAQFVAAGPAVTLAPATLDFGIRMLGSPGLPQHVTLTNSGSAPLLINGIGLTGAHGGDFAQTNDCGSSLVVGASCTLSVSFTPTAVGSRQATLVLTDNAPGGPHSVPLSGFVGRNVLHNGGFEGGPDTRSANYWSINVNATRSMGEKRGGVYALQHQSTTNASYAVYQVVGNLEPGARYTVGGWVNIPDTSDAFTFSLLVQWRNASDSVISTQVVKRYSAGTNGWSEAMADLVAPAGTSHALMAMKPTSLSATVYVDNLVFRQE